MILPRLTIGRKLGLAFTLILSFMLVIALIGWLGLQRVAVAQRAVTASFEQAVFQVRKEVDHLVWVNRLGQLLLLESRFTGALDPRECDFGRWYYAFGSSAAYRRASEPFRRAFAAIDQPHRLLHETAGRIVAALERGERQAALDIYRQETLVHLETLRGLLAELGTALGDEQAAVIAASNRVDSMARWTMVGVALITVLLAAFLSLLITRSIVRPIRHTTMSLGAIAEGDGDLTRRLDVQGQDEIADLARAFNRFAGRIHDLVKQVMGAATQVAAAAEQLSLTSGETRAQVLRQQSEVDQVATAMNEMATTVQEVAHHAMEAAHSAQVSDTQAAVSRDEVKQTVAAIESLAQEVEQAAQVIGYLSEHSQAIGKILDVIRGIAEQTNLLALNAAIEAARAGEQGRGFAVVADEVRTLAARTQTATAEVQTMIERLQSGATGAVRAMEQGRVRAREGVGQAARTGDSLHLISASISTINDMNAQIASAAEEQSAVAEEINRNLTNISASVDQTAQGSGQIAAASEELARLAAALQGLVGRFHI